MRVANDQEGDADPASEQRRLADSWAGGRAGCLREWYRGKVGSARWRGAGGRSPGAACQPCDPHFHPVASLLDTGRTP